MTIRRKSTRSIALYRRRSSSCRLRAELNRDSVDQLELRDHVPGRGLVFLEMRRFQMRPVGVLIGVDFKDPDVSGMILHGYRVKGQNSGLHANGSFDFFAKRCLIGVEPGGIDLDFSEAHIWMLHWPYRSRAVRLSTMWSWQVLICDIGRR